MFITPKWARELVAEMDDRKAHGIKVRIRTAAIFYAVVGLVVGILVSMVFGVLQVNLIGSAVAQPVGVHGFILAHNGQLAKDGCHKDKKANERHWHVKNSTERGGECVKRKGATMKLGDWQCRNVKAGRICFKPAK